jgi:flagellar FliL protein
MAKEAPAADAAPPKSKKKLIIIVAILVALLALGGGAAFFLLAKKPTAEEQAKHEEEAAHEEDAAPVYEKLETFTVNLADGESFLQVEIQLSVADAKVQEKIKKHMPEVRDGLLRLLSSKSPEELATPEGKDKLSGEVQAHINEILGVKKASKGVKKVLFNAFIIQ